MGKKKVEVENKTSALKMQLRLRYCTSKLCKSIGLMFRFRIRPEWGIVLVGKKDSRAHSAVNMLFVFCRLGIIWVNNSGIVVDKMMAYPWISFLSPKQPAKDIIEVNPMRLNEFNVGDRISFERRS